MIRSDCLRTGHHNILVYVPLLAFTGVEGKTFEPMALTVMIALGTRSFRLADVRPAAIAIAVSKPRARGREPPCAG